MRTAWTFDNGASPDIHLEVNPSDDVGSLAVTKEIAYSNTSAYGKTVIFEKGTQLPKVQFNGTVYTSDQLLVLQNEIDKDVSVMTDDRGVQYSIVWESCTTERKRSAKHPWKHTYNLIGFVLEYTIP